MINTTHFMSSSDIVLTIKIIYIILLWYLLNSYIKFT